MQNIRACLRIWWAAFWLILDKLEFLLLEFACKREKQLFLRQALGFFDFCRLAQNGKWLCELKFKLSGRA
jgi:hypothetical protein